MDACRLCCVHLRLISISCKENKPRLVICKFHIANSLAHSFVSTESALAVLSCLAWTRAEPWKLELPTHIPGGGCIGGSRAGVPLPCALWGGFLCTMAQGTAWSWCLKSRKAVKGLTEKIRKLDKLLPDTGQVLAVESPVWVNHNIRGLRCLCAETHSKQVNMGQQAKM